MIAFIYKKNRNAQKVSSKMANMSLFKQHTKTAGKKTVRIYDAKECKTIVYCRDNYRQSL
jgi:hypothetical protein